MPLTDRAIKNAIPADKPVRMFDGGGLYVELAPSGGKWWRLKYRVGGKEKRISLGVYPDVSLKQARDRRDAARRQLAEGVDPSTLRKAEKVASVADTNTFEAVAREWLARWSTNKADSTIKKVTWLLQNHLLPWLGSKPIADIEPPELLACLRRVEHAGRGETAHRCKQTASAIFAYGIACGYCPRNPAADLARALTPVNQHHHPAITDPHRFGELLRSIDTYRSPVVKAALQLQALTFVRPVELREARWGEVDTHSAQWKIPAPRMKMRDPHIVPLSLQAVAILNGLRPLTDRGQDSFVFPSYRGRTRPLSEATLGAALCTLGYPASEHVPHGFRSSASTMLHEQGFKPDVIEAQLAHRTRGVAGIYNRAAYLPERRKMMRAWADYLDVLRVG